MTVYQLNHSAVFALDLMRRDREGMACFLAASALATGDTPPPLSSGAHVYGFASRELQGDRDAAFLVGGDRTLEQLSEELAQGADRDRLAALTVGQARDVWEAVVGLAENEDQVPVATVLADAVLGIWTRQRLTLDHFLNLTIPARSVIRRGTGMSSVSDRGAAWPGWLRFAPHTEQMRNLILRVETLTTADLGRLAQMGDVAPDWEDCMEQASWACEVDHKERAVALAQFLAVGVLAARTFREPVGLGALVVVGTSLVGAVQATMMADQITDETYARLMRGWGGGAV